MKKSALVVGLGLIVMASGCASPGGMRYIGPISAYTANVSDKNLQKRAVAVNQKLDVQQKAQAFKFINMGADRGEWAPGLSVDVFQLFSGDYTFGEKVVQGLATLGDAGLYTGAGWGVSQLFDRHDSHQTTSYTINNNGNGNNNNINSGSGNQSNNSASDGAANGDVSVSKE